MSTYESYLWKYYNLCIINVGETSMNPGKNILVTVGNSKCVETNVCIQNSILQLEQTTNTLNQISVHLGWQAVNNNGEDISVFDSQKWKPVFWYDTQLPMCNPNTHKTKLPAFSTDSLCNTIAKAGNSMWKEKLLHTTEEFCCEFCFQLWSIQCLCPHQQTPIVHFWGGNTWNIPAREICGSWSLCLQGLQISLKSHISCVCFL